MGKPTRYCKRGHDKFAPHGSYIENSHGYAIMTCAVCKRKRWIENFTTKGKEKKKGR